MSHQISSGERDITAHIGALELSAINFSDDGALEGSAASAMSPTQVSCLPIPTQKWTHCVGDGALEAVTTVYPGRTRAGPSGCRPFIDDGMLENAAEAKMAAGPTSFNFPGCPRIDDGVLEGSAASTMSPTQVSCLPIPTQKWTHCVDDGALEATIHAGPQSTQMPYRGCFGIDDGMLEEAVVQAGPRQVTLVRNSIGGCQFVEITDAALEASCLSMVAPTMDPGLCRTRMSCGPYEDRQPPHRRSRAGTGR